MPPDETPSFQVVHTDVVGRVTHRWFHDYEAAIMWADFVVKNLNMTVIMRKDGVEICVPEVSNAARS